MKILIIGNGFDLAHGLPTSYKDFLNFIKEFTDYYSRAVQSDSYDADDSGEFAPYIKNIIQNDVDVAKELYELSQQNSWLEHFQKNYSDKIKLGRTNWIDFESEISDIVQVMEKARDIVCSDLKAGKERGNMGKANSKLLEDFFKRAQMFSCIENFDEIKNNLIDDLNKLVRCLEIYLTEVVEKMPVESKLHDLENIFPDFVLSFNYTNTYQRLYGDENDIKEYCFIHGKANINHDIDSCDLVLGIDEYLDENEKNIKTEFIQFKKFFQRIYKKTGSEYMNWIGFGKKIEEKYDVDCDHIDILIFGHSLDVSDKDILKFLVDRSESRVSIFYHNKEAQGRLISNMVRLIGQDMLINRVHGDNPNIHFVQQSNVME